MSLPDTNSVVREYLVNDAGIIAFFAPAAPRIYCPRLPENCALPSIGFFTRGGTSTPYIPDIPTPSYQFDCWAKDIEAAGVVTTRGSIKARELYRKLYDALQGIQNVSVEVPSGSGTYYVILSAREEVQGQDLVDVDVQGYFRVLTFFEIMVR